MDVPELYHRTFLPYTCPSCHAPASAQQKPSLQSRFPQLGPVLKPGGDAAHPSPGPKPAVHAPPAAKFYDPAKPRLRAYRISGKSMTEVFLSEKIDQRFKDYCTPFERSFSRLISQQNKLDAVVDERLTVIGHVGMVSGYNLVAPRNSWPNSQAGVKPADFVNRLVKADIPVFLRSPDAPLPGDVWQKPYATEVTFNVLTTIDGQVLACLSSSVTGIISEECWAIDLLLLAKGLADLGIAAGKKIVKTLARRAGQRGARSVFMGPTKELADDVLTRQSGLADYIAESGMTRGHFKAFQDAARESKAVVVVRDTNTASTKLIEMGCPGKPKALEALHTSKQTGVVTAADPRQIDLARAKGFFVVDSDGIARRTLPGQFRNGKPVVEELKLEGAAWKVEKGQVIDPTLKKPVVGDYDLMGVFEPAAAGRNVALVAGSKGPVDNVTSPLVQRFTAAVNAKLDRARVLHGAQDQYAGFKGSATAFLPDGRVVHLADEAAVQRFYQMVGRQTRDGKYASSGGGGVDELAARRAQKGG